MPEERSQLIGKWISLTYRQALRFLNQRLKPYDLTSSDYIFVINLDDQEQATQQQLAEKLTLDKALAARNLKSLENKGYVIRQENQDDRRANLVALTERGRAIKPVIAEILAEWTALLARGLSAEEYAILLKHLKHVAQNAVEAVRQTQ